DVEVEMGIQEKLSRFPVSRDTWDEFYLDQEINDRGIAIDPVLVESAIKLDTGVKASLMQKLTEITGLENPNSVLQMRTWLSEHGLEMESLGKKEVAKEIKTASKELVEVLTLRQQLSKSSVKKYTAMKNAACTDNRERGMFRYYGANRTGRFAGRLVQLQNLPQNHLPDLADARALVKLGNVDAIEILYEDIPDTLSQLIRTAFVPQNNNKFIVADFSAIEARVLA
ncbi:DNA polymerase, partial [Spirosoma lituiforme]